MGARLDLLGSGAGNNFIDSAIGLQHYLRTRAKFTGSELCHSRGRDDWPAGSTGSGDGILGDSRVVFIRHPIIGAGCFQPDFGGELAAPVSDPRRKAIKVAVLYVLMAADWGGGSDFESGVKGTAVVVDDWSGVERGGDAGA